MSQIAKTPSPPYYVVIFTSERTDTEEEYQETAARMLELAARQPGFLGVESARSDGMGITVSYWKDETCIRNWKNNMEHREAQRLGVEKWYRAYFLRVAKVERAYNFEAK